jgi:hypothetical protein
MKIKISTNGFLLIKRATEFKKQLCPRQKITGTGDIKCGDWCPLFGDPENTTDKRRKIELQTLTLCHGTLIGHVIDKRGEVEDEAT